MNLPLLCVHYDFFTFAFCFLIVDGLTPNDSHTNLTPPVTISQSFDQHACGKLFCCFLSVFFFGVLLIYIVWLPDAIGQFSS